MSSGHRRLFIALPVDDRNCLDELKLIGLKLQKYSSLLKIVSCENYHITLKFFGEISAEKADLLIDAFLKLKGLNKISYTVAGCGAFSSLDRASVLWVGIDCDQKSMRETFNSVEALSASLGYPAEKRGFTPHLTVARVKREIKLPHELIEYLKKERGTRYASSVFKELVLFESELKKGGAEYKRIASIDLA